MHLCVTGEECEGVKIRERIDGLLECEMGGEQPCVCVSVCVPFVKRWQCVGPHHPDIEVYSYIHIDTSTRVGLID